MPRKYFTQKTFKFLKELKVNNNRDWFNANKSRYEAEVRGPALDFIEAMGPRLEKISSSFVADPRKTGGSLMRVYRDTRFSKDKTPYKTNIGIQFRHELGKDVHAPGFYLHLANDESFIGVGLWHPESSALAKIREAIAEDQKKWLRARNNRGFRRDYKLAGESLKRPPRGYPADHPMIEDLKRKDFIAVQSLVRKDILDDRFLGALTGKFRQTKPFMSFLCEALEIGF